MNKKYLPTLITDKVIMSASNTCRDIANRTTRPIYNEVIQCISNKISSYIMERITLELLNCNLLNFTIRYIRKRFPKLYKKLMDNNTIIYKSKEKDKCLRYHLSAEVLPVYLFSYENDTGIILSIDVNTRNNENDSYNAYIAKIYLLGFKAKKYKKEFLYILSKNLQEPVMVATRGDDFIRGVNIYINPTNNNNNLRPPAILYKEIKSFDDIIMPLDKKKSMQESIHGFISNKNFLKQRKVSMVYGIMIYGNPGTGKSSLAQAIGNHVCKELNNANLDVAGICNVSISDTAGKCVGAFINQLEVASDRLGSNAIFIINDIDTIVGSREDPDSRCEYLDAFLKLLDGSIIDDAFVIMTTNHIEKLDPALTRSGRINMTYFMDNLEKPEAEAMCKLYDLEPDKILEGETFPINPAYLTDKCISEYK